MITIQSSCMGVGLGLAFGYHFGLKFTLIAVSTCGAMGAAIGAITKDYQSLPSHLQFMRILTGSVSMGKWSMEPVALEAEQRRKEHHGGVGEQTEEETILAGIAKLRNQYTGGGSVCANGGADDVTLDVNTKAAFKRGTVVLPPLAHSPPLALLADHRDGPPMFAVSEISATSSSTLLGNAPPMSLVQDDSAPPMSLVQDDSAPQMSLVQDDSAPPMSLVQDDSAPPMSLVQDDSAPPMSLVAGEGVGPSLLLADLNGGVGNPAMSVVEHVAGPPLASSPNFPRTLPKLARRETSLSRHDSQATMRLQSKAIMAQFLVHEAEKDRDLETQKMQARSSLQMKLQAKRMRPRSRQRERERERKREEEQEREQERGVGVGVGAPLNVNAALANPAIGMAMVSKEATQEQEQVPAQVPSPVNPESDTLGLSPSSSADTSASKEFEV